MRIRYNKYLNERLGGMLKSMDAAYEASIPLSNTSKGDEREWFVNNLLSLVFPTHYRFSSGEITDRYTNISGQVDIVVEFPHRYSLAAYSGGPRLFMAESVASVIEVKSDLINQWDQVCETARKLKQVRRTFYHHYWQEMLKEAKDGITTDGRAVASTPEVQDKIIRMCQTQLKKSNGKGTEPIPIFAVGYDGWKTKEKIVEKIKDSPVDGIFVIKPRLFSTGGFVFEGSASLSRFLSSLENNLNENVMLEDSEMGYQI